MKGDVKLFEPRLGCLSGWSFVVGEVIGTFTPGKSTYQDIERVI
jgi:hypothetical protein